MMMKILLLSHNILKLKKFSVCDCFVLCSNCTVSGEVNGMSGILS